MKKMEPDTIFHKVETAIECLNRGQIRSYSRLMAQIETEIGELEAEITEARKKHGPEPTELTKKGRSFISQALNNWGLISVRSWVEEACDEIDRLTTKREHLLEKVALQGKEADNMRHVLDGVKCIVDKALTGESKDKTVELTIKPMKNQC